MLIQKSAAAVHDISGLGKCSLTAAVPVLSAAGISLGVLPTAVLSTQTGGLNEYTYRDLTDDLRPMLSHWRKLGVRFDAVFSGFLGSGEQADIVSELVEDFMRDKNSVFLCDPAMADNGKLYNTFDEGFVKKMSLLCSRADIIVPNITEAYLLLGENYTEPPYSEEEIERVMNLLSRRFPKTDIVLTGVCLRKSANLIGCASYSRADNKISYSLRKKIDGMFHSTGDLFASALLGSLLNGFSLPRSCETATDFVTASIKATVSAGGDSRFGLCFEKCLPQYMKDLELI